MNIKDFEDDVKLISRKLTFHQNLGGMLKILSLGLITNYKKINEYKIKHEKSKDDLRKYQMLLAKAIELDQSLETIIIEGVRISKDAFSDIPVMDKEDYGMNWESIRDQVLSRDNYECQESDGSCSGPLQIHHIIHLSRGGTNKLQNLMTLCLFHHSLKHDHMREKYYGNIWS